MHERVESLGGEFNWPPSQVKASRSSRDCQERMLNQVQQRLPDAFVSEAARMVVEASSGSAI
ncbi:hypothetical protein CA603_01580 [Paraburkholderia hospita]|nr:hypothetical protein CA603_01580 [Paraburkholderia hospita]